ncbi:hypothetical protein D0C36_12765 [Mucilaginibacter conchicola]|uniref:Cyanovirin-N domain-containing protein n=1 Tax=Mucilaginibacter conchicola TaxID=2303333 RepID=A0A372NTR5_9SPHI|nr:CVNH domain-containing protein [Mucilaginibacter conchicola]RFZ92301.1 hypothetical protein D0C36_12765 [Mucilaginibacter conchicola]
MEITPLNPESIQNALNQLRDWFPEQAATLKKHNDELVQNILKDTEPDPNSPLGKLAEQPANVVVIPTPSAANAKTAQLVQSMVIPGAKITELSDEELFDITKLYTPCTKAVGKAMLSSGLFVLSMVGIRTSASDRMYHAFLAEFGPVADKFTRLFNDFDKANTAYQKGKLMFKIGGGLLKASCFKAILKSWAEEASWFDWVTASAFAIAQFTVWFATEGVAFIAEVVLLLANAGFLIKDIANAVSVCTKEECAPLAAPSVTFTAAGSFINTADNVKLILSAQCKNIEGKYIDSSLDISKLAANTQIDNNNGVLVISKAAGTQADTFKPVGSYRNSSQNIKVTLSASCLNMKGNRVDTALDVTDLDIKHEIANSNGQLKAE